MLFDVIYLITITRISVVPVHSSDDETILPQFIVVSVHYVYDKKMITPIPRP